MASILDLISGQVNSAAKNVDIPANLKDQILGGLSNSVLSSLTQTVTKPNGVQLIQDLVSGKTQASSSPVTALASNLFSNNILKKLNLGKSGDSLLALVPVVMGSLGKIVKDQDGDGDVDFNDLIITLKGNAGGILGAAKGILGSFLKK